MLRKYHVHWDQKKHITLSFKFWYQYKFFGLKIFLFSVVSYCYLSVTSPVMITKKITFVKVFLLTCLVRCVFLLLLPLAENFATVLTFYCLLHSLYSGRYTTTLWLQFKFFLYLINFVWMFTFERTSNFHVNTKLSRRSPSHVSHLPSSLIFGRTALNKCDFKF